MDDDQDPHGSGAVLSAMAGATVSAARGPQDIVPSDGAAASKASEADLRLLADFIPQLAWMADRDGSIFWYNQRWYDYTGTSFEQMQGWGWREVHHPDHIERVVSSI